jgi:hypothetical protein
MILIVKDKRSQILFISNIGNKYIQIPGPITEKVIELKPTISSTKDLKPRIN